MFPHLVLCKVYQFSTVYTIMLVHFYLKLEQEQLQFDT